MAFVTNNAARPPGRVAEHLRELGVPADAGGRRDLGAGGGAGAGRAVRRRAPGSCCSAATGLARRWPPRGWSRWASTTRTPRRSSRGYGPDVLWRDIMRAAVRIRDGLPWVASNTDLTIPTDYGVAPGHGVLVETIRSLRRGGPGRWRASRSGRCSTRPSAGSAAERPLMVGDRLDTDIEGARDAGIDSLLVLTGVTGLAELVAARPGERPTYLAPDLDGLLAAPTRRPTTDDDGSVLGGWRARVEDGRLLVDGDGDPGDWWRVVAAAAWRHLDEQRPAGRRRTRSPRPGPERGPLREVASAP